MAHALEFPLRKVGLASGGFTVFALTPGSLFSRLFAALVFSVLVSAGSRFRQICWVASGMSADPPRGGEWAGATFGAAVWAVLTRFWVGDDMLLPMAGGLAASHTFAKLSCLRIGCCKWKTRLISSRGPFIDAIMSLTLAVGTLVAAATFSESRAVIGIIAVSCLFSARIVSMSGQGRRLVELGSISIASTILIELLLRYCFE